MYGFNISTANTLKNSVSTTKATSGLPVAPDGYIYVKVMVVAQLQIIFLETSPIITQDEARQ